MTPTREELLAQRAEIDAKLAALDAEPDPLLAEAREIAATAWSHDAEDYRSGQYDDTSEVCALLAALRRGMELIPAPPPMGEDEIEALASKIAQDGSLWASQRDLARLAIRETLRRVPAWPKTGEQPWIDWHGGECPVPAETRVEVRFRDGLTAKCEANGFVRCWANEGMEADIVAYRILSGEEA